MVGTEISGPAFDFILSDDLTSSGDDTGLIKTGLATVGVGNHHSMVSNTQFSSSFDLGLMIHEAKTGDGPARKQVQELRLPPIPVRQSFDEYDFTHTDPLTKLVFSQDDWSGGGFQANHRASENNKYSQADGVDLRWPNMAVPGMRLDQGHGDVTEEPVVSVGFLVRDPSFESATLSDAWTEIGTPTSTASVTTDPRSGDNSARHLRITGAGSGDGVEQALNNPTIYQSKEIVFTMFLKKVSGTGGVTVAIEDDAGTTTSSTITNDTYVSTSVTRTINGAATFVKLSIKVTGAATVDADDGAVIPTGGATCKGTTVFNDKFYGIFGRVIARYNGNNGTDGPQWDAVFIHATATATDIEKYQTNVFVGFGAAVAYEYGADTTWTTSTLSGDAKFAIFWAVSRNTLWKSEDVSEIRSSTSPLNGGSWSTTYTIGDADREITNLYSFADTVVAGKEDGIWFYRRVYDGGESADLFFNQTNEYDKFLSTTNFSQGVDFLGFLWLISANQSVFRTNLAVVQDITSLVSNPLVDELSGSIRTMTNDTHNLYMAAENGLTGSDALVTLISLRETSEGLITHPMDQVLLETVDRMDSVFLSRGTDGIRPFLMMMGISSGGVTNSQKTFAWYIPEDSQSPIQSSDIKTNLYTVTFDTATYHGGTPLEIKSLVSATIWTDDHSKENVTLAFGRDGESSNAISAFTFTGPDNVETQYFEDIANPVVNAAGRAFQFQFGLVPDSVNAKNERKLRSFAIEMTLRPERVQAWRVFFEVGGARLRNGANQDNFISKSEISTKMGTLERQGYPIVLNHDFEQDGTNDEVRVIIRPGTLRQTFQFDDTPEGMDIWEAVFQRVITSAS